MANTVCRDIEYPLCDEHGGSTRLKGFYVAKPQNDVYGLFVLLDSVFNSILGTLKFEIVTAVFERGEHINVFLEK